MLLEMFEVILTKSFLGYVNTPRNGNLSKPQSFKLQAAPKSSTILNACEEIDKYSEGLNLKVSGSASVGVIGGVSVNATLKFLRKIVEFSAEDDDDGGNAPPFVLCSDLLLSRELLAYERSKVEGLKLDSSSSSIVQNLVNKRVFLESSGVSCIVMPCHVSHCWYEDVSKECSVPFLHMADCVARKLKEAKLKPLEAGNPLRIGVLATNATLAAGFYQDKLQNEVISPTMPHIM